MWQAPQTCFNAGSGAGTTRVWDEPLAPRSRGSKLGQEGPPDALLGPRSWSSEAFRGHSGQHPVDAVTVLVSGPKW